MTEVLDDELAFVLMVHEVSVESGTHAFRHVLIHTIVEAMERRADDERVRIEICVLARYLRSMRIITMLRYER